MKRILLLILGFPFLISGCVNNDDADIIESFSAEFQVSGQLLYSCENPRAVAFTSLKVGNITFYTDSLGKFSHKVTSYKSGPYNCLEILSDNGVYSYKSLVQGFYPKSIDFGKVYAIKPKQIPVVVSYDLSSLDLKNFPTLKIPYSRYARRPDKASKDPADFLNPDTVLFIVPESTGVVIDSSNQNNFWVDYSVGQKDNNKTFKVTSFCDTARVTIRF